MPEVYNWHLGRKMLYPYEERHPKWQFAFVFNINRCLACQTCSMADKSTWLFSKGQEYMWWNNVETKPYGGYPQFYDVKITQLIEQVNPGGQVWNVRVGRKHHAPYGVFEGMTIFDAGAKVGQAAIGYIPTDQEWRFVNIYEDTATSMRALVEGIDKTGFSRDEPWKMTGSSLPEHETFFFYLQRICNHCTYPGCLAACPRKAIYKRPGRRDRVDRPEPVPGLQEMRGTVPVQEADVSGHHAGEREVHCVLSADRRERPLDRRRADGDALYGGLRGQDPDAEPDADRGRRPVGRRSVAPALLHDSGGAGGAAAVPAVGDGAERLLHPPRHSPRGYARQMFGPGVDNAIEKYLVPSRELLGGAATVAGQPADHLPVRCHSGAESVRDPDPRETV